jgi:transcriptional regulator with XRE-family HTH domain
MNGRARWSQPLPVPANQLIRHARRRAGRTQQEVAGQAGVPVSMVVLYELGRRIPTWEQLQQLVMACGFWLDVRLRELRPPLGAGWALAGPRVRRRGPGPNPLPAAGVDLDAAAYLGHRLRSVREELAAMASSLEAVAESFKDDEWRHYERFSRLVAGLSAPSLDQALAGLEQEFRLVQTSRGRRRAGPRRPWTLRVDPQACDRLADRVAYARRRLALAVTRLRAERLDEMAYAVELQDRELDEIEQAFRIRRGSVHPWDDGGAPMSGYRDRPSTG